MRTLRLRRATTGVRARSTLKRGSPSSPSASASTAPASIASPQPGSPRPSRARPAARASPSLPACRRRGGRPGAVEDHGLTADELDGLDGALTGCTVAIAETGTIVLTAQPHEGRRALTLVPDLHICVVRESQICELVPEALDVIREHGLERRPITLVSGPSATSDIELSRVEGVHGPRTLVVLVAADD